MHLVRLYAGFLLLFGSCLTTAQVLVREVKFEGLEKTKEDFVEQFVQTGVGDQLDSLVLEADRQRLANLEMLANAEVAIVHDAKGATVTFQCQEVRTLLPIINFGGVEDNVWFLVGVTEANMLGRGHKFLTYYQYYDRSSVSASLFLNRMNKTKWSMLLNFVKWSTEEPLFFDDGTAYYNYDNFTYGAGVLYHFNFLSNVELSTAYFTEEYNRVDEAPIEGAPQHEMTQKQLVKVIYRLNKLNYHYFYLKGIRNTLNVEAVFSYDGDPAFQIIFDDFRMFHRVGRSGNIGNRWRVGISSNHDTPFAPFVLDSYVNIRGVGNRVDRGTAVVTMNNEYRHAVFEGQKLALQLVGFSDFGTWRTPGGELSELVDPDNFLWFCGAGARFIHKEIFNAILRIDYGVEVISPRHRGFVIGIGQYF